MTDEEPADGPVHRGPRADGPPATADGGVDGGPTVADGGVDGGPAADDGPSPETVVETASEAAEGLILSRYKQSEVDDLDVTVRFEDGTLEVDVYLNAPDDPDPAEVVQEAVEAAESAVDELFETE